MACLACLRNFVNVDFFMSGIIILRVIVAGPNDKMQAARLACILSFGPTTTLKNVITIKDSFKKYSSRQLRMLFVLHRIHLPMNYGEDRMNYAISIDHAIRFFLDKLENDIKLTI